MLLVASELARDIDKAFWLVGGVSLVMLLGITGAMIWFAVHYRRGRRRTTTQVAGHPILEAAWIIIPTLIVTWMFFVGIEVFTTLRTPPPGSMIVQVTGRQWAWSFHYPDSGIDSTELVVPVGTPIKAEITSPPTDVTHSFFIPDFRLKEDAVPGKTTYLWFEADRTGDFHIFCAEFCGKDHSQMLSRLRVVTPAEFEAWKQAEIAKRYRPLVFEAVKDSNDPAFGPGDLNIDPKALYGIYCASCHGAAGDAAGGIPEARHFTSAADWKRSPKVVDIYRTLAEGIPDTQMRPFPNLTPWQKVALAHHVRTFLGTAPPEDSREDYDALVQEYRLEEVQPPAKVLPIDRAMELLAAEGPSPTTRPDREPTTRPDPRRESP